MNFKATQNGDNLINCSQYTTPYTFQSDMERQSFNNLKGDNRELVLAAAHIEDAKTGR